MKRPEFEYITSPSCLCYQAVGLCLFNVCLSSHLHFWNSETATKQIKLWSLLHVSYPPGLWQESSSNPSLKFKAGSRFEFSFNHINLKTEGILCRALNCSPSLLWDERNQHDSIQEYPKAEPFLSFILTGIKQNLSVTQLLKNVGEERPSP